MNSGNFSIDKSSVSFTIAIYLVATILLLVLATVIKKGDDVLWINGHYHEGLDSFFGIITNLGVGLLFVPIVIFLLFFRYQYVIMAVLIWIIHGTLCYILKHNFFRVMKRPSVFLSDHPLHFAPHISVHTDYSFPSGHSATIFCATLFISLLSNNRKLSMALLVVALLVGYSRIYLLQHFLVDVAGGATIGIMTTLLIWYLFRMLTIPTWMNKSILSK